MKLWVFSDLHLEFGGPLVEGFAHVPDADVAVVAGDVLARGPENSLAWLSENVAPAMPVVCVAGNHEFYGAALGYDLGLQRAQEMALPGMHFLEDAEAVIGGVRFLGATLWTDFELDGDRPAQVAWAMTSAGLLNDFRGAIADYSEPGHRFTPQRSADLHGRSRTFLKKSLVEPFDGPTVVVTHHAPHPGSVHPRWNGSPLNACFTSDLGDVIETGRPDLWVHGHVHDAFDYMVGDTRVVCNPAGYANEDSGFDPGLVVEVE